MIPVTSLSGRAIALFGLGGSGLATAKALLAGGADIVAWDDNPESVGAANEAGIPTGDLNDIDWGQCAALVLAPGVPLTHPRPHWTAELANAAGTPIIGDVELFCRERAVLAPGCPFIAITGTNGKSTTTALIAHILKDAGRDVQMGGNIGRAILTLDPPTPERFYVVECSSYQIDLAPSLDPSAGILLNLSPDHLDRHGDMAHYASVKERLVAAADTAIIGVDDPHSLAIADRVSADHETVIRISTHRALADGIFARDGRVMNGSGGTVRTIVDLSDHHILRGQHNAQNVAAAIAACRVVGLDEAAILSGIASFTGLAHRMQPIAILGRTVFVNDSKATNAEAAASALASFERVYWIAGGLPKEGGIGSLSPYFPRIAKAYLIGEAAAGFAATLSGISPFEIAGTVEKAVEHAARDASRDQGDEAVVLFSPACASFDQFANFEKRGDAFVAAVQALVEQPVAMAQQGES